MECNICSQQKHKLYCTKCVKEGVRQQNYQLVAAGRKRDEAAQKVKDHLNSDARQLWLAHAERDERKVVVAHVRQEIDCLHGVIRKERQRLENVKTDVATRKSNLASATKGIKASHASGVSNARTEITRVRERRDNVHQNIATARRSRCKEAADLLGLRRISQNDDTFAIAGITVADLYLIRSTFPQRNIVNEDFAPAYVVLGLSHATHLLTLLTDYLSLKLPYEIIPPSRGISYPCIRKSSSTKPLPIYLSPDKLPSPTSKVWSGKKIKDIPGLDTFVESITLLAWDVAWVLWTQQLWNYPANETLEACRIARNLFHLVTSPKIGRISQGSTIEFLSTQEALGVLEPFTLSVKDVQERIQGALEEDKTGEADGGGWDLVEGGEEVIRGDGWLKLNHAS